MQKEPNQSDSLSPEIQDVMRNLISAFRAVKLYPPNNPVYSQSVKKAHKELEHFLEAEPDYSIGVQKTQFTCQRTPLTKDGQLNKAIAQDLFAKGVREILFIAGVTDKELLDLCQTLALPSEELAMKSGISSILWEKGADHIKVTEAGLDEVITTKTEGALVEKDFVEKNAGVVDSSAQNKKVDFSSRTLVLGDLMTDPSGFGVSMLAHAKQTKAAHESVENRLYTLYQEAGRKIQEEQPAQGETLFEGLANSALTLESPYREGLIAGKLYGDLDTETADVRESGPEEQIPNELQEIQTGRFSSSWTTQQVATLLKKSSAKAVQPSTPLSLDKLVVAPLAQDLGGIVKEMAEYKPEEMEALKTLSESGMESDIIAAAVRTLLYMLPLVKNPFHAEPTQKEINLFSGVAHQLEDLLSYLLMKKEYALAGLIIDAFHKPVDPAFKPRITEALKKTAPRAAIVAAIQDLRKHKKDSAEYQSAYAYVSGLERAALEVLLEVLADEQDRATRIFLLDLVKDLGKNHVALLGEHLSDERWYFVRNIVSILGDSKTDQAIAFLRKASDHENVRIRQEVIKGLLSIGGKKAAGVLAKMLRDQDADVQTTAMRAFTELGGIGKEESKLLVEFLAERPLKKKDQDLTLEAIKALGKIGGLDAAEYLQRYSRIRWWKPHNLQKELRQAAQRAMEKIKGRVP